MLKIINGKTVLADRVTDDAVYVENGKILAVGGNFPADETVDADGCYVAPGFIDTHVHGGGNADFMDGGTEPMRIAAHTHLCHGTTTILPTTLASTYPTLRQAVKDFVTLSAESGTNGLPHLPGMHLEGPNFNPAQAGAQPPDRIYPPKPEEYHEILALAPGKIRKWSFAPELPGALEFCDTLVKAGVTPGMGHTDATYAEILAGYDHGAKYLTHLYSGMSTITRKGGYRVLGAVESGYLIDDLWVEIIADGDHLPPELLRMIFKLKRHDRIHLVTDAMRGATMPEGPSFLGRKGEAVPCVIEDGVAKMPDRSCFAGSVATTDRLVRTVIRKAGLSVPDAVSMMTKNPASLLGLTGKGEIKAGMDADLVFFDENVNVRAVYLLGVRQNIG